MVIGKTRLGKTVWARSLGNHIYWNGIGTISSCDWVGASYIVVDDTEWEFFKCKKQLLGAQYQFSSTEKYRAITTITFGKPCIYLCNEDPREKMTGAEEVYYRDNCQYVFLGDNDTFF